jgi:hypothetical protein
MNASAKKWMDAGAILAVNPSAIVPCPERDGTLIVRDQLGPDGVHVVERFMVCSTCGAQNSMRLCPWPS